MTDDSYRERTAVLPRFSRPKAAILLDCVHCLFSRKVSYASRIQRACDRRKRSGGTVRTFSQFFSSRVPGAGRACRERPLTTAQTIDLESALTLTEGVRTYLHNIMLQFGGQMTANQIVVLLRISLDHVRKKKCTVQSIAESEGISQQTVSGCVVRLEAHGYVEPQRCPEDGRVRYLRLSGKGIELSEAALSETLSNSLLSLRGGVVVPEHLSGA